MRVTSVGRDGIKTVELKKRKRSKEVVAAPLPSRGETQPPVLWGGEQNLPPPPVNHDPEGRNDADK